MVGRLCTALCRSEQAYLPIGEIEEDTSPITPSTIQTEALEALRTLEEGYKRALVVLQRVWGKPIYQPLM